MSLTTKDRCSYIISTYTDANLAAPALQVSSPNDLSNNGDGSPAKLLFSEKDGKAYMTSSFYGRCTVTGDYYPKSPEMTLPATAANSVVVTIDEISEPSGAELSLTIANCSNGKAFTTSELGVYTFDAPSVALIVQRKPKNNDATTCRGVSSIGYSVVSLTEYCTKNSAFKDCGRLTGGAPSPTTEAPSSTTESPSTTSKTPVTPTPSSARKNAVFAVATVCMMVASALSM